MRQLYSRAAEMRLNPTPFEVIVWKYLCRSQLSGNKFRRQHVIVPYIVDFYCPGKGLAVEIDGRTHVQEKDIARDAQLIRAGVTTLHFTNEDVGTNIEGVVASIQNALDRTTDRWGGQPHPNPSPEGEGL
ncbi:endonuclease domain-containing protein [Sphingorhabdus sp.]|uniref:endonuclease domain-containing protein n=1 Tax=Sphingorhabdus sp. TaxID=1902408 RepID=UPI0035B138F8